MRDGAQGLGDRGVRGGCLDSALVSPWLWDKNSHVGGDLTLWASSCWTKVPIVPSAWKQEVGGCHSNLETLFRDPALLLASGCSLTVRWVGQHSQAGPTARG